MSNHSGYIRHYDNKNFIENSDVIKVNMSGDLNHNPPKIDKPHFACYQELSTERYIKKCVEV